jgi:hypothetical protein
MEEDRFGLRVCGELNDSLAPLQPPYPGLSVQIIDGRGWPVAPFPDPWGWKFVRSGRLSEISLVLNAVNALARVLGPH